MIYNYTSSKRVIGKVFRDFGIQRSHWVNDAVEWTAEALEFIGVARYPVHKLRIIKAEGYRVRKPEDLYMLENIYTSGTNGDEAPDRTEFKYSVIEQGADRHMGLYEDGKENDSYTHGRYSYYNDARFFKMSFEEGWVAIEYKGFPIDGDGFPLIPDAAEFTEAISWYIMMKLLLSGKNHPVIDYNFADQKWERKCVKARNAFNMPDKNQYRGFKDKWVRLIPNYERSMEHLENFVTAENVIEQSYSKNIIGD